MRRPRRKRGYLIQIFFISQALCANNSAWYVCILTRGEESLMVCSRGLTVRNSQRGSVSPRGVLINLVRSPVVEEGSIGAPRRRRRRRRRKKGEGTKGARITLFLRLPSLRPCCCALIILYSLVSSFFSFFLFLRVCNVESYPLARFKRMI